MTSEPLHSFDALLAQSDWVTALARALVRDRDDADDLVQATWFDLVRRPPQLLRDPRKFLATLLRRQAQRQRRSRERRQRHEAAATTAAATVPSAAELTERLHMHRELVDAVLALDEPYRAVVVLRFLEQLDVDAIAARTGRAVNTVRSQLQRALQLLRERLDRGPGGRERWFAAVLPLAQRRLPGERLVAGAAPAGAATGIALVLSMKKLLGVAAAVMAVGVLFWFRSDDPQMPAPTPTRGADPGLAAAVAPRADVAPAAPVGTAAMAREAARVRASRWLLDAGGRPLAGVAMRAASPWAVRWQGGDRGWISGPEGTRRLDAAEEERLRSDPAYAATWFAQFAHPDEWRAEVLGTALPAREVRTADDGGFEFGAEAGVQDADVEVADPGFVLLARGRNAAEPWRAGPATRVIGTVRDAAGTPLDALVMPLCPELGGIELPAAMAMRTDDAGRFLLRKALANGLLRVRCEGYATAFVPLGPDREQTVDVVLTRHADADVRRLDGVVVDVGGRPIAGASVWFGRADTRTGADGRFAFALGEPRPGYALTIVARGYTALQRDGFGAEVLAPQARTQDLLFVLEPLPPPARGIVLGSDGRPLAGALVRVVDATLLDLSFTSVEARLGGHERGVHSEADGTFTIAGLSRRAYRLAAIDPATGASVIAAPQRVDDGPWTLRLPGDLRASVRGRVVRDGEPLARAQVEIGFCTHVTKGGGTQIEATAPVDCDDRGSFELRAVPRRGAWLQVRLGGKLLHVLPVESLGDGELTVVLDGRRWLQLVGTAGSAAATIAFELADGTSMPAATPRGPALLAADGSAPVLAVPATAVAVLLDAGSATSRRFELTDDLAVHLRVR